MTQFILLIVAVYAVMVGYHGNGPALFSQISKDLPKFFPWIIGILFLGILAVNSNTKTLGKPLLLLVAMGLILKKWPEISSNGKQAYTELTS